MNDNIPNRTHAIYKWLHTTVAGLYLTVTQVVYELVVFRVNTESAAINIFLNIAFNGVVYYLLYQLVKHIYQFVWIRRNKDCYIAGKWYHIHTKDHSDYLRVGILNIKQHFFDISVEGHNYQPCLNEAGELEFENGAATHWRYTLAELSDHGNIYACYSASKKSGKRRSNKGIHQLMVLEHGQDGYPTIYDGDFGDIFPSTSEGYLRLYRAGKADKKTGQTDRPELWLQTVKSLLAKQNSQA